MSTSRPPLSRNPTAPKPPTIISPTAILSETASLTGTHPITLAANSVIHPRAKLVSTYGPVKVGEGCIVYEKGSVGLLTKVQEDGNGVELGRGVVIEAGAVVEARHVGQGTIVEGGASVESGAVVGKHCKIGPLCTVTEREVLPNFTVVYGMNQRRRDRPGLEGLKMKGNERQVEVLRTLIPSHIAKFRSG